MKRDCIIHARNKYKINKLSDGTEEHVSVGLTCEPIPKHEKESHFIGSNGGYTVAILKNPDGKLNWGFAKCNLTDTFNKRIGRIIAENRASHYNIQTPDDDFDIIRKTAYELFNLLPTGRGIRQAHVNLQKNGIAILPKK
ncbi:hypothetical protein KY317_00175 [Candidatus Woesearchaeota archaeon]|nr:hypothetical protein [Candidatus Woesearchaeota archaeon]